MAEVRVQQTTVRKGLSISDLILLGVLLAAGAVLKFVVGSLVNFGGMKPNFIIAMYCLAVMLVKPKFYEAAIVGLIAGAICQLFPGTPLLNLISEPIGAIAMALLILIPLQIGKLNLRPVVCTFVATLISGFVYLGAMYVAFYSGLSETEPVALLFFLGIIFGTAMINAVIVQVLYIPLKHVLKKDN